MPIYCLRHCSNKFVMVSPPTLKKKLRCDKSIFTCILLVLCKTKTKMLVKKLITCFFQFWGLARSDTYIKFAIFHYYFFWLYVNVFFANNYNFIMLSLWNIVKSNWYKLIPNNMSYYFKERVLLHIWQPVLIVNYFANLSVY